jgi:phage terminase large subunit
MIPTIKPEPKQHLAYQKLQDSITQFIFFGGGAGGGKSWLGCEWLITNCYFYPESKWFIGRKELKRLMTTSFVTFRKVCKFHQIPQEDWNLNSKWNYIEWKNGSRIDLLDFDYKPSDPDFERFGSSEYTGGWNEEAGEMPFKAFDVLKSRVGRQLNKEYGLLPKMLNTCNPTKNWIYPTVYKPYKEGKLPIEYAFIQALYKDNSHTAESYGKQLDAITDKATRERLKFGNWEYDDDPTALIDYEAILDLFTNTVDESSEKYMTVDVARFGVDKTVIKLWRGWEIYKIYIYQKQSTEVTKDKIKEIARDEKIPYSHIAIDEDGVGGGVVDGLPGVKGFTANSSPLPTKAKPDEVPNYKNLKTQCSYLLAEKINTHGIAIRLNVVSEVEGITEQVYKNHVIEELEQIKAKDPDKDDIKLQIVSKDEVKENIRRSPDYADPMVMRMLFELKKTATNVSTTVQGGVKKYYPSLGI